MTIDDRRKKLNHFITCLKCELSGKACDENCPTQYEAGNMGEIVENLEAISKILEQQPCEDCISRETVHDLIAELLSDYLHDEDREKIEELDVKIEDLEPVTPKEKTRWIPVSERLPEERKTISGPDVFIDPSEEVLAQMKSGCMKVSRYWGSREGYRDRPWIDLSYPTTDEVIAWMSLPERYKDGE